MQITFHILLKVYTLLLLRFLLGGSIMINNLLYRDNEKDFSLYIPSDVIKEHDQNPFLKNLVVTQLGYFYHKRNHYIRREGIGEYILVYCIDGEGFLETDNKTYMVSKGDLFFCDVNYPHAYGAMNTNPWSIHWGHFIGQGVPELFSIIGISKATPLVYIGDQPKILNLLAEIREKISSGYTLINLLYASNCFLQILCYLAELKVSLKLDCSIDFNMENMITFMLGNVHSSLTLDQLASQANMSKYHFSRLFKENTGYSPIDYFSRLKIQKACNLLYSSSFSIKEISDLLSFNNQFYFSKVFKKITGYSPSDYRMMQMAP